ncbi:DUF4269 domain-containing protein [Bradyrhizobium sp. USDA 3364]
MPVRLSGAIFDHGDAVEVAPQRFRSRFPQVSAHLQSFTPSTRAWYCVVAISRACHAMTVGHYTSAVTSSAAMERLKPFDPRIVGTLPLGLAVPGSDVDIVCHAPDPNAFADIVWTHYQSADDFTLYRWTSPTRPVIARFVWDGWAFELFGDQRPVEQQPGWIHFEVERRLLALDDGRLQRAIRELRTGGAKTEPAFAAVLGISGDPYRGLIELAAETDATLRARLAACDFGS